MAKIETSEVVEIIQSKDIAPALLREIIEEINRAVEPDAEDEGEEKGMALKKQWSIVVSDPEGKLPEGLELVGWVVKIPEDASVTSTLERVHKAAYEFNTTKRGRKMPVQSVADAMENVPAKALKEQEIWVKTKAPVFVVRTDNTIPSETTDRAEGVTMKLTTGGKTVTLTSEQMRRASERLAANGGAK